MKTWILKGDLSHSPQAAFRLYACGIKSPRLDVRITANDRDQGRFIIDKIKSPLKSLSRLLDQWTQPQEEAEVF